MIYAGVQGSWRSLIWDLKRIRKQLAKSAIDWLEVRSFERNMGGSAQEASSPQSVGIRSTPRIMRSFKSRVGTAVGSAAGLEQESYAGPVWLFHRATHDRVSLGRRRDNAPCRQGQERYRLQWKCYRCAVLGVQPLPPSSFARAPAGQRTALATLAVLTRSAMASGRQPPA